MSDQNTPVGTLTDTGSATIGQGGVDDAAKASANGADEQSYLLNYASREDAEKGHKELQASFTRASQEKAELQREIELLRQQTEINALKQSVQTNAEQEAAAAQRAHEEAFARQMEALKEKVEDEGAGVLVDEFNSAIYNARRESEEKVKMLEKKLAEVEAQFNGKLGQTALELSPEYQRLKPTMDQLKQNPAFAGMSVDQLMAVASEVKGKEPENDLAPAPPGMGGSRAGVPAPEGPKGLSEDMKAALVATGLLKPNEVSNVEKRLKGKS